MSTRFRVEPVAGPTTENVSTLEVLMDWTDLGPYNELLFWCSNADDADFVDFIIETSEDGVHPEEDSPTLRVSAGKQRSLEVGPYQSRKYWRLSAQTSSPTFPTVSVTWGIRGTHRAR